MASQPSHKKRYEKSESEYSLINLIFTIAKESFKNVEKPTHISIVNKNGNGEKVIRTKSESKDKLTS